MASPYGIDLKAVQQQRYNNALNKQNLALNDAKLQSFQAQQETAPKINALNSMFAKGGIDEKTQAAQNIAQYDPERSDEMFKMIGQMTDAQKAQTKELSEVVAKHGVQLLQIQDPAQFVQAYTNGLTRIRERYGPEAVADAPGLNRPIEEQKAYLQAQITDAMSFQEAFKAAQPKEREIVEDVNGVKRYVDTGEQVFEGVTKTPEQAKPSTDVGKARADLQAGFITEDEFNTISSAPPEFQTSVGKLITDRQTAVDVFGSDSEQVKAIDAALNSETKGEAPKLSDVAGVRKEFTKLSGDFIKLRDAIGKVEQFAANPSPAGDLAMIFNFMKIQDPGSVVRESEYETAQNATSLPGRLGAGVQRVLSGEKMLPEQRQDFLRTAMAAFKSQEDKQKQLEESFKSLAESQGMKPEDVVIDFKVATGEVTTDDIDTLLDKYAPVE